MSRERPGEDEFVSGRFSRTCGDLSGILTFPASKLAGYHQAVPHSRGWFSSYIGKGQ